MKPHLPTPGPYRGRYAMHRYWSKKPHEVIAALIDHYSSPGEIVADPFCGSGVSVVEAIRLGRRAVGVDINPIAIRQTRAALTPVDPAALREQYEQIRSVVEPHIRPLYLTRCPRCETPKALTTHTIRREATIVEAWLDCLACKRQTVVENPKLDDPIFLDNGQPEGLLMANSRLNLTADRPLADLFTARNRYSLDRIRQAIAAVDDDLVRETFELCFTAALSQASRLVFVIRNRRGQTYRARVGSWVSGFWLPSESFEIYPWRCFDARFKRMMAAKADVGRHVLPATPTDRFDRLCQQANGYCLSVGDAAELTEIADHSIDYIVTDPPHGDRIPYLELSQLWNGWLDLTPDWNSEIVISDANRRGKDRKDYRNRLHRALKNFRRILKVGRRMSIIFNTKDWPTWEILFDGLALADFSIESIDRISYSSTSLAQDTRSNALTCDLIITCLAFAPWQTESSKAATLSQLQLWLDDAFEDRMKTDDLIRSVIEKAESVGRLVSPDDFIRVLNAHARWSKSGWRRRKG